MAGKQSDARSMVRYVKFDLEKLNALKAEGWLRSVRHPEADLWIFNYTQQTQYRRHWTPETLACRGLILDGDGGVVARPFAKFFNLGEPGAPGLPVKDYKITEKIDGSLMVYYELGGEPRVASRGSFTSDQAVKGMQLLREHNLEVEPGTTPVFELLAPWNRIVVNYGDREDLILLDCIDHETGLSAGPPLLWTGDLVEMHDVDDPRRLREMARPNAEGFVVSWENGAKRVKIKFEQYVRLHRVVSGLTERRVWEALKEGDDLRALEGLPDETFAFIDEVSTRILREIADLRQSAEQVVNAASGTAPRKELAAYFFASSANPNLCFTLLDGRGIEKQLWRLVEPAAEALEVAG